MSSHMQTGGHQRDTGCLSCTGANRLSNTAQHPIAAAQLLHDNPRQLHSTMPPKAQTNVLRGRGRPKRAAASKATPAPVANAPEKKRRRVAKVDAVEALAESPKKRGRPAKVQQDEPVAVLEAPRRSRRSLVAPEAPVVEAKKRMGRPAKKGVVEAPVTAPKQRAARSTKAHVTDVDVPAAPKPRGRPARNAAAVDLSRVAGTSRVTKSRSKPTPRATTIATKTAPVTRMDPRMRSKLRTRAPPAQKVKEDVAPQPTKRRGRPPKTNSAAVQAPSPKKPVGRKATKAAVSKPRAPRKKRGYTTFDIPDKFAAQVRQYIQELEDADSLPTPVEDEAEPEAGAEEAAAIAEAEDEDEADEEGGDTVIEEEVFVTSATAGAVLEGALTSEANADQDLNADGEEEHLQDEYNQDIVDHDSVDESAEPATEVDLEMSFQEEEVYMDGDADDVDALAQQGDANMESPGEDTEVHAHDVESSAAVGFLFN